MKPATSALLWRYLFMPLTIIAVSGFLVVGYYGRENPPVTALIWIAVSITLGVILLRGERLPQHHRTKEMQRRDAALSQTSMVKRSEPDE